MSTLTFVHLSDIHFKYGTANTSFDEDDAIRNELLLDIEKEVKKVPSISGILISGDIAFAGRSTEYEIAYSWLEELCKRIVCTTAQIWMVPGNHDIDRSKITDESARDMRQQLRAIPVGEINQKLKAYISSPVSMDLLFSPLSEYNAFAIKFGCASSPNPLFWEQDFTLNDGSILRLRGINSTLVSDQHDSDQHDSNKLVLSTFQTSFKRSDGITYMTLCHHPLDWLRDKDEIAKWLDAHVKVQLFGHKHTQRVKRDAENIVIYSGAMHPERGELGWEPRYNLISLDVSKNDSKRSLRVQVNPRVWNDDAKEFLLDQKGEFVREVPLGNWVPADTVEVPLDQLLSENDDLSVVFASIKPDLLEIESNEPLNEVNILNAGETLTNRYLSLPHSFQMQIARKLGLQDEADRELSDTELYRRYFKRAKEKRLLEQLWTEVEIIYSQQTAETQEGSNPFKGR